MENHSYNVIGVMSGTSLDGVDLAHVSFTFRGNNKNIEYNLLEAATIPYTEDWVHKLRNAIDYNSEELDQLNVEYTELLAGIINAFIKRFDLRMPDAICSHGHTILHQPNEQVTLQIGNLPQLAQLVGCKVVCDFRIQDVIMGGQGAPLVPLGDALLFSQYDFCLNLGGFSNVSFATDDGRKAYDICAVNTVLNHYAGVLGYAYDNQGELAKAGKVHRELFEMLNSLEFYKLSYPKSLGFEFVKLVLLPLIESYELSAQDKLATYTMHIAQQLAISMTQHLKEGTVLVTGGGAYNLHLIDNLRKLMPNFKIIVPDDKTIQYKEALLFALLGVLRMRNEINVLASVTGAPKDHSAGYVYSPI